MTAGPLLATAALALLINILITPLVLRIGCRSVSRWITVPVGDAIQDLPSRWRIASGATALILWGSAASRAPLFDRITSSNPSIDGVISIVIAILLVGLLAALLTALVRIDWLSQLLPDPLTLAMITSGLLFHYLLNPDYLIHAVLGAAIGYGLLWAMAAAYKKLRGLCAMGRGDFAMTAALGAWLGWQLLPFALSLACISGLVMVLVQRQLWRLPPQHGQPEDLSRASFLNHEIPFGPALAVGFILAWVQIG